MTTRITIEGVTADEFERRFRSKIANGLRGAAASVTRLVRKQIADSFKSQSDPETGSAWLPLKRPRLGDYPREPILDASGKGKKSIHVSTTIGAKSFTVTVTSPEYMALHNSGGTVLHPGSDKRQFLFEGSWWGGRYPIGKYVNYTQPHLIPIPRRRWIAFTPDIQQAATDIVRGTA